MDRSSPSVPIVVTYWHLSLCLLLQVENAVIYRLWPEGNFYVHLLFHQLYTISSSLAIGTLYYLIEFFVSPSQKGKFFGSACVYLGFVFLCNLWIICDQVGYKVSNDHVKMSMNDQSLDMRKSTIIFGSFLAELDSVFFVNCALLLLLTVKLAPYVLTVPRLVSKDHPEAKQGSQTSRNILLVCIAMNVVPCIFGICGTTEGRFEQEEVHPIAAFVYDIAEMQSGSQPALKFTDASTAMRSGGQELNMNTVYAPYKGKQTIKSSEAAWMNKYRMGVDAATKDRKKKKNVIVYIVESVGSKQLLGKDGVADPALTPNIAKLQQESVTFNKIYDTFPSTTRTHMPMATGGLTSTQGSIGNQNTKPYNGKLLTREFQRQGYQTGLFAASDLRFEGLAAFYKNMKYDKFHHYGIASKKFRTNAYLNSWGGNDHTMAEEALDWFKDAGRGEKPFFAHLLPDATHHPYSVPRDYKAPFQGGDPRFTKYKNSLHYTDYSLGVLVAGLKKQGLYKDTVIILTGDHGEAFGRANGDHPRNFLHKNFLYDENIVSFLMLHDPSVQPPKCRARKVQGTSAGKNIRGSGAVGPCVSSRLASVGDDFPTTIAFVFGKTSERKPITGIPGQNLLSPQYHLQMQFFHKTASPLQWGMRDGKLKMISNQVGAHVELYDLEVDPEEKNNLANDASYKKIIDVYQMKTQDWYIHVHCWFTTKLANYDTAGKCDERFFNSTPSMRQRGPKKLVFGHKTPKAKFEKTLNISRDAKSFVVFNEWVPYQQATKVVFDFAPVELHKSLKHYSDKPMVSKHSSFTENDRYLSTFKVMPGWHTTWFPVKHLNGLKPGKWEVIIWSAEDATTSTRLLSGTVEVVEAASKTPTFDPCASVAKSVRIGHLLDSKSRDFEELPNGVSKMLPKITIQSTWHSCDEERVIEYKTADPSNEIYSFKQRLKPGWIKTWYYLKPNFPSKTSTWHLTMRDTKLNRVVGTASFNVTDIGLPESDDEFAKKQK
jgi:arylsulfatase A-like enzyme